MQTSIKPSLQRAPSYEKESTATLGSKYARSTTTYRVGKPHDAAIRGESRCSDTPDQYDPAAWLRARAAPVYYLTCVLSRG